jgi:nucleotide-binding universal stress UspA family protein
VIQVKKILCPTDFSDLSLKALRFAGELGSTFHAELHLLHVFEGYENIVVNPELAMTRMAEWLPRLRELCHEKLAALPGATTDESVHIVRANREGSAVTEIVDYARLHAIDLIVIGTHGRTGLSHLVLGSVAENVIRRATCPVWTIRATKLAAPVANPLVASPKLSVAGTATA